MRWDFFKANLPFIPQALQVCRRVWLLVGTNISVWGRGSKIREKLAAFYPHVNWQATCVCEMNS